MDFKRNIFLGCMKRHAVSLCQIMFGIVPVEHHVFLRKVRFLLRFKNSDNLICSPQQRIR